MNNVKCKFSDWWLGCIQQNWPQINSQNFINKKSTLFRNGLGQKASIRSNVDPNLCHLASPSHSVLACWGLNKMANILQTTFSNAFCLQKNAFWLKIHWSLILTPQLPMNQQSGWPIKQIIDKNIVSESSRWCSHSIWTGYGREKAIGCHHIKRIV